MRRTRILSTVGPASDAPERIAALLAAGTDAFRLNFSHGTVEWHRDVCGRIRAAAAEAGRHAAVLQDLAGPKIRIGSLDEPLALEAGDRLTIALGDFTGGPGRVACAFPALFTSAAAGHRLLVDDGRIELEVVGTEAEALTTRVVVGGVLGAHKGINLPDTLVDGPALTDKDRRDLATGIEMGVDLVALSFVQTADDVRAARAATADRGAPDLPIIAKIERPQAVDHLDAIVEAADGVMVARGDLGLEMPLERLPAVQQAITHAARRHGRPVIVATQVLESMRTAPRPTRAEVTDAAHAVGAGVDAIMLAGETAVGAHPVRAVSTLATILAEAERSVSLDGRVRPDAAPGGAVGRAICEAAVTLAERAGAAAIVALTEGGRTARMLAALRPGPRIVAVTAAAVTAARLSLVWGVEAAVAASCTVAAARTALRAGGVLAEGETIVFVSIHPALDRSETNFVRVEPL